MFTIAPVHILEAQLHVGLAFVAPLPVQREDLERPRADARDRAQAPPARLVAGAAEVDAPFQARFRELERLELVSKSLVLEQVLEAITSAATFLLIALALAWIIRTIVEQKRWNRSAEVITISASRTTDCEVEISRSSSMVCMPWAANETV